MCLSNLTVRHLILALFAAAYVYMCTVVFAVINTFSTSVVMDITCALDHLLSRLDSIHVHTTIMLNYNTSFTHSLFEDPAASSGGTI